MFSSLFGSNCTVDIQLFDIEKRKTVEVQTEKGAQRLYVFTETEPIKGKVIASVKSGKKIEHQGIKIDFIGQIELFYDRGNHYEFTTLTKELSPPGVLNGDAQFEFDFTSAEKQYESYNGINVRLRYFLKFSVVRSLATNITKELDVWVINFQSPPEINNSIKMEVGIEDCLHIEFEYGRSKYSQDFI
eukprot:TRINITY_DN587_c0_g1_i2.p1 TRINITY_DN587_c0_g1~~TRINITY_DN587_c0_g1_i2.p1  ORF type:complete len:188 (-),score=37.79 TRINITY_DN587_c0_g1_i2:58-621(-)